MGSTSSRLAGTTILELSQTRFYTRPVKSSPPSFLPSSPKSEMPPSARHFLYISIPPIGCVPAALSYPSSARDSNGCIPDLNAISSTHSSQLLSLANDLGNLHPDASLTFLD
ncbi:hypothetical protein GOP47_0009820 [Adiantum capillus-veneris]|uniref:Uncharacterized protein n=1 Tax=Adiantum capillus-veneris TaxID=13818 RepID=A0A9D4ZHK7_ADICA|nr:hypothetical protein GOP47_0009820 [Adiantum capillus-veneris]